MPDPASHSSKTSEPELTHEPTSEAKDLALTRFCREDAPAALAELHACCVDAQRRRSACADETEWLRVESESLVSWARDHGWLWDAGEFGALTADIPRFEGGSEHLCMYVAPLGRVLKVTKPPFFGLQGDLLAYVNNIVWCNTLFGDDIRFAGVLMENDTVSMVISQPYVLGRSPEESEVAEWFEAQGYEANGHYRWLHPVTGAEITDAHTGNLIVMDGGQMVPIDLQVLNPGRDTAE